MSWVYISRNIHLNKDSLVIDLLKTFSQDKPVKEIEGVGQSLGKKLNIVVDAVGGYYLGFYPKNCACMSPKFPV